MTVLFWLYLTICPDHVRGARCETTTELCHLERCLELVASPAVTGAIMVRIP